MSDVLSCQEIDGRNTLVYRYRSPADIDDIIIQLINESSSNGLLKIDVRKKERLLTFQTDGLLALTDYTPEQTGMDTLLHVYRQLYKTILYLEDSFIDARLLVFDESAVFLHTQEKRLYLAVLPVDGISGTGSDLTAFLQYLLAKFGKGIASDQKEKIAEKNQSGEGDMQSLEQLIFFMDKELQPVSVEAQIQEEGIAEEEEEDSFSFMEEDGSEDAGMDDPAGAGQEEGAGGGSPFPGAYLLRRSSGEIIPLTAAPFIIGKVPLACDYVVGNNPALSRIHAIIRYNESEDQYYIIDCNSTNHVYLNGVKIEDSQPCRLQDRMCIHLANEAFIFTEA